jgi:nucleoside-diphosphate-sugar epimerase
MILVTGAAGFVGSALCTALGQRGMPFIGAVRHGAEMGCAKIGNINGTTDWTGALSGCNAVIHLAARVHVMHDRVGDPLVAYREVNVDGTLNLAKQAAHQGVRRFVFVSSVKVNGEATRGRPFVPQDMPVPLDPYGQSKLEAELALREVGSQTGMEIVIVRPPLVYGPGVKANFFKLMRLVKCGVPLPFKEVRNRRSMVALDNLIDFLLLCAVHRSGAGRVFFVSDDNDLSIAELIIAIARSMGKQAILLPVPERLIRVCASAVGKSGAADRLLGSLQVDIADARTILGWRPVIGTDMAVQQTVDHFLSYDN